MADNITNPNVEEESGSAFINDETIYNKTIKTVPKPPKEIGVDTDNIFLDNIIEAGLSSKLDIARLDSFTQVSQRRDQIYNTLDSMARDPRVSAVLEVYAEDATEYNDHGVIMWAESKDADVAKYINFLLQTINVDKHLYEWTRHLCKYGDLYLKLFRTSDTEDVLFPDANRNKKDLNEDVNIKAYSENDKYTHYIEMIPNPAEMFELVKFGKTYGYIKATVPVITSRQDIAMNTYFKYNFKKTDVDVYPATEFVHACIEDNTSRSPEEVNIFLTDDDSQKLTYSVKRGQSLLYPVFKVWRELSLLEDSVMLNRITKSSIVRLINIEIGDMPKENVGPLLDRVKTMLEQKSALDVDNSLNEYTNPGPVENNVYIPTRNGQGKIETSQVGGDVDVKSLADLDYFKNIFYSGLKVPKQYFNDTDDSAGFNGGSSLSIISSRYAKSIKRIQNVMIQALTDAINLMLLDKGLDSYVNNFELHLTPPTTQEEMDRRENLANKVQITSDILNLLGDVDDTITKLKLTKSLLASTIDDPEVISILEEYITNLEESGEEVETAEEEEPSFGGEDINVNVSSSPMQSAMMGNEPDLNTEMEAEVEEEPTETENTMLPSPSDLGVDLTDNNAEI